LRRTLLAAGVAGAVIAIAWLEFEQPIAAPMRAVALALLALAVAVLPGARLQALGSVGAAVLAVRLAFGIWLPRHPIGGSGAVWSHIDSGFVDFYSTHLPFDPRLHANMAELVLLAVFVFTLAVGLLAAARKPVSAALLLLVGAGWPATLIVPAHGTPIGAAILGAAFLVLAVAGTRRISGSAVPFALVLVLGGIVVGTATASNHPVLNWQGWNITGGNGQASVRFIWDAQYRGIRFPKAKTTMLDVRSRKEPAYFRATVLDDFVDGRWVVGPPRDADALEPAAALRPANQTKEVVTIEGLVDRQLLGGTVPVRFDAGTSAVEAGPGFAQLPSEYARGFQYTAWSYDASPTSHALAQLPARYPASVLGMLDVGHNVRLPVFGSPGHDAEVMRSLSVNSELAAYRPLARLASQVTRAATTPYAAVVDLEHWFLVDGGFAYSNHPRIVEPPLVGFATTTRSGYCQYFAGAMALMLRYSGIPARVAVGFAGPTFNPASHAWTFTDHDAHAWVEVWFKGYGWLPFDPTPAFPGSSRARLIARYTGISGGGVGGPGGRDQSNSGNGGGKKGTHEPPEGSGVPGARRAAGTSAFPYALVVVVLVLVGAVGGIALAKEARRRARRLARDPRRIAAACREELASFLLDQGVETPPSATVRELGLLAHRSLGADSAAFVAATTAARFGRPEAAADAARAARHESRSLLASCRRVLTRRDRLRGFFSLRSLARARWAVDGPASLGTTPP
jgi:transglutaminase-like putative cysteine protease